MQLGSPKFNLSRDDAVKLGKDAGIVGLAAAIAFLLQGLLQHTDMHTIAGISMATICTILVNVVRQWSSDTQYSPPTAPPFVGPAPPVLPEGVSQPRPPIVLAPGEAPPTGPVQYW